LALFLCSFLHSISISGNKWGFQLFGDYLSGSLPKGFHVLLGDLGAEVGLVSAQKDFGVLGVGDDVEEVLRQHVERGRVVQREHEDGRLRELVVARRDGRHPLHAAGVPQLQLKTKQKI